MSGKHDHDRRPGVTNVVPCVQLMTQLVRRAPGVFDARETERELDNFPLVNVTHPDLARHPSLPRRAREQRALEVEVPEGAALLLPAYWHHQVESFAAPGQLNVAVNYWFQGHSLATRLYRTLRENVFINCTQTGRRPPARGRRSAGELAGFDRTSGGARGFS